MKEKLFIRIATAFRKAITSQPCSSFPDYSPMNLNSFPNGCCGDTSQTLATYIFDQTGLICSYALGENGGINKELVSHAWLEFDDLVIDITADQFQAYNLTSVYVGPRTNWYNSFKIDIKPDGRHSSLQDRGNLDDVYSTISGALSEKP